MTHRQWSQVCRMLFVSSHSPVWDIVQLSAAAAAPTLRAGRRPSSSGRWAPVHLSTVLPSSWRGRGHGAGVRACGRRVKELGVVCAQSIPVRRGSALAPSPPLAPRRYATGPGPSRRPRTRVTAASRHRAACVR